MSIDLSTLLKKADCVETFKPEIELKDLELDKTKYPVEITEPMQITVTNLGSGKLNIQYQCAANVAIPCARCLKPVKYGFSINGECEADLNNTEGSEEEDEAFFVEDKKLYPELLLADEILMQWPIRVLCKADCKGICSRCGADLNVSQCDCESEATDLRMAAIKDIFSQYKEV